MDRSFIEQNNASTERLKRLVHRLTEADLAQAVGPDWTVGITLAHLAFWDQRVLFVLNRTEKEGKLVPADLDSNIVNDIALPTWKIVPGRDAARLAVETAVLLDQRLEAFPETLLEQVNSHNPRWVTRSLHRNEHLDEIGRALQ
jgi:hypothetical protein